MQQAVLAIHFGEPPDPDIDIVREYLTNIFFQNADLEDVSSEKAARQRAAELAERRAPGLIEEYETIGGSPMNEQARDQVDGLAEMLDERGFEAQVELGFQFMEPTIESQIESFSEDNVEHVIAIPIYPLCGPSTTVAALDRVVNAIDDVPEWNPALSPVAGWHRHPDYIRLRVNAIASYLDANDIDPTHPATSLIFSAHGTPIQYLEEGSRYQIYVEEFCETVARLLGPVEYEVGYQNHENRDIPWTKPAIESVLETVETGEIVVDPVSFMHEQSETLVELDDELAAEAAAHGLDFHRVPIPHDDPTFSAVLGDIVEPFLAGVEPAMYQLRSCECADDSGAMCLNAPRR